MEFGEFLRYFVHGILFSVLYLVLAFFWIFILVALVSVGLIIGFIIGFVVFFFFLGGINVYLTDRLWDVSVRDDWKSLLEHGFILFVVLILVSVPAIVLSPYVVGLAFLEGLVVKAMLFIAYAFLDGFLAKNVGELWEEEYE